MEKSWICHRVTQGPQGISRVRGKDKTLQVVCYRDEDETGKLELENRGKESDVSFLIVWMISGSLTYFKIHCYTLNMCGLFYQFLLIKQFFKTHELIRKLDS